MLFGRYGWIHDDEQAALRRDCRHVHGGAVLFHAVLAVAIGHNRFVWRAWICLSRWRSFAVDGVFYFDDRVCSMATQTGEIVLQSTITCPECGHVETETMPTNACQWFYDCKGCAAVLKPLKGDCCVYCSYATVPCPPIQAGDSCCS